MSGFRTSQAVPEKMPLVLPAWTIGVPAVLLMGFLAMFGRAGVGIQLLGLPLGAYLTPLPSVLVMILLATARGRELLRSFDRSERRVAIAVGVAVGLGLLRAAAQGVPTLLTFQDLAYLLHLPWIVVGLAAMKMLPSDRERSGLLSAIAWTLLLSVGFHTELAAERVGYAALRESFVALLATSDKPNQLTNSSLLAVLTVATATLSLTESSAVTLNRLRRVLQIGAGLLMGIHLAGLILLGGSRGAALATLCGLIAIALLSRPKPYGDKALLLAAVFGFVAALLLLLGRAMPEVDMLAPPDADRVDAQASAGRSVDDLLGRYRDMAGNRSLPNTLNRLADPEARTDSRSGTEAWRLAIWGDVVADWNASPVSRAIGVGFGNDIPAMTTPGRQGWDGLNRGVHSIFFTVLARQGASGVIAFGIVLGTLGAAGPGSRSMVRPLLVAALVVGSLDVFLEGVHGPILVWLVSGLLFAVPRTSRLPTANAKS